jgi:hypothetical protein
LEGPSSTGGLNHGLHIAAGRLKEISLHILDIAENGISAGGDLIQILVDEQRAQDRLIVEVTDNGRGIPEDMIDRVIDPFVTSRTTRRVGLGLSLLKAAAERCDGAFRLTSQVGKGTRVAATFRYDHIDRAPVGDMAESLGVLVIGNPGVEFAFTHRIDHGTFTLDTREIKQRDGHLVENAAKMFQYVLGAVRDGFKNMEKEAGGSSP